MVYSDKFLRFDKKFKKKYGDLLSDFPYFSLLVEKELRNMEADRREMANKNLRRLAAISLKKFIYAGVKIASIKISSFFSTSKNNSAYISLSRFPILKDKAIDYYEKGNVKVYSNDWSSLRKLVFGLQLTALPLQKTAFKKFYKKVLIDDLCSFVLDKKNRGYFSYLDDLVKAEVFKIESIIEKKRIKYIICEGDSTPSMRIICLAAKNKGAQCVVVAHGYIQDPFLITIAPVYADEIFVWTEGQKKSLLSTLSGSGLTAKISYAGCPVYPELSNHKSVNVFSKKRIVFFALEPVPKIKEEAMYFIEVLQECIFDLIEKNFDIVIRPHPKDFDNSNIAFPFFMRKYIRTDKKVEYFLNCSSCVVTTNSSVAFQALIYGLPSYQIKELSKLPFDGVPQVHSSEIAVTIERNDFLSKSNQSLPFFDITQLPFR